MENLRQWHQLNKSTSKFFLSHLWSFFHKKERHKPSILSLSDRTICSWSGVFWWTCIFFRVVQVDVDVKKNKGEFNRCVFMKTKLFKLHFFYTFFFYRFIFTLTHIIFIHKVLNYQKLLYKPLPVLEWYNLFDQN